MDLRFNPGSTQKVVIGHHLLGSPDANYFKPTLKYDSASSVVNVTFETTSESTEFLWLGFIGKYIFASVKNLMFVIQIFVNSQALIDLFI